MTIDDPSDPKDLVRRGYDVLSWHYRTDDAGDGSYGPWLATLRERLPAGAGVLDLGCGCGIPVADSCSPTGTEDGWLGGPAPMWWSHAGAATYRGWIHQAGLKLAGEELVPDRYGSGSHPLFWARRPRTSGIATRRSHG